MYRWNNCYFLDHPLLYSLNEAIVACCIKALPNGFRLSDDDHINTYERLVNYYKNTGMICVWAGSSDKTIYQDHHVNTCFRAWHDKLHIDHELDFSLEHEQQVCGWHKHALIAYGMEKNIPAKIIDLWCVLMDAEITAMAKFNEEQGYFPQDQRMFVLQEVARAGYDITKFKGGKYYD